jgi:MFS family permease
MRVLRIRNYRVYTIGNTVSLIGMWIQRVAVGWLAWQLTHSGAWLGLIAAADLIPTVAVSPFAGALADRVDRVKLIRLTQVFSIGQAWVLAFLVYAEIVTIEELFLLTLAQGLATSLNQPARLALIPSLVDRDALPSAVAWNSLVFNLARFIGPAVAGVIIAELSSALAFAVNACTYVVFSLCLARLAIPPQPLIPQRHFFRQSLEGYAYALRHPGIGQMMMLFAVTTVALRGFIELFPGFADSVFGRGAQGLAWLTATVGLGAMAGGLWMLRRSGVSGLTGLAINHTLFMALAVLAFTGTSNYWLALSFNFVGGFAMTVSGISAQTLVQTAVVPSMRGRVMGVYGMVFRAGPALGALLMGWLANSAGFRLPVAAGAALCVLSWLWARLHQRGMAHALEEVPAE